MYKVVSGKLYDDFYGRNIKYNELEIKILENIRKIVLLTYKIKCYLIEYFIYQNKVTKEFENNKLSEKAFNLSILESGFYQLSTNHLYAIFSNKKDKQISLDYLLGQLIENALLNKINNILDNEKTINKMIKIRENLFDTDSVKIIKKLKEFRDKNTAHYDIDFKNPENLKIREVHNLFLKINNNLYYILKYLNLKSEVIYETTKEHFNEELNLHLIINNN